MYIIPFGTLFLLWAFMNERKRSDDSKKNLHARVAQLEEENTTMLRETLGAIHKVIAVVAESGREVERTATAVEKLVGAVERMGSR